MNSRVTVTCLPIGTRSASVNANRQVTSTETGRPPGRAKAGASRAVGTVAPLITSCRAAIHVDAPLAPRHAALRLPASWPVSRKPALTSAMTASCSSTVARPPGVVSRYTSGRA